MKICLVGVELFHADGQASVTKLMVAVHILLAHLILKTQDEERKK
jgi:hypothetical protein